MTADAGTVEAPKEESPKRVILSEDLALTTAVAVATTVAMTELGFGRASAAVGVAASALITDVLKNVLVRRRIGKRPLVAMTLLLLLLSTVRDALGAVAKRLGLRPRDRKSDLPALEAARASGPFPWRGVLVTSAVASAITVGLFTAPELAVGKSLVSDRRTTFFSPDEPNGLGTPNPPPPAPPPSHSGKPLLHLPERFRVEATGPGGARIQYPATAVDSDGNALEPHCTPPPETRFSLGATTVTCEVVDRHGNVTRGAFAVIVRDATPPSLSLRGDLHETSDNTAGRRVKYEALARDLVDGPIVPRCRPSSGARFPIGRTTIRCTAVDAHGNRSTRTFTATLELVGDHQPPELALSNARAEATSAAGARVEFRATAKDGVDGSLPTSCTPSAGATFHLGVTTVRCTAKDSAGNRASGTLEVTVVDTTPPALRLPKQQTVEATSSAGASADLSASAADLVDGAVEPTCSPASGTVFSIGTHTVSCSATDRRGNRTSGTFGVTVRDTTGPELHLPSDLSAEARSARGAKVSFKVWATDLVSGAVTPTCSSRRGLFPLGTTLVSCSAVDERGNRSAGSFRVHVVDTTAPTLKLPGDSKIAATWNARKHLYEAAIDYTVSARDSVDGALQATCEPPSGFVFSAKDTRSDAAYPVHISCNAVDRHGNRVSGSFTVTVTVSHVE